MKPCKTCMGAEPPPRKICPKCGNCAPKTIEGYRAHLYDAFDQINALKANVAAIEAALAKGAPGFHAGPAEGGGPQPLAERIYAALVMGNAALADAEEDLDGVREACVLVIRNTMGASNIGEKLIAAIRAGGDR